MKKNENNTPNLSSFRSLMLEGKHFLKNIYDQLMNFKEEQKVALASQLEFEFD